MPKIHLSNLVSPFLCEPKDAEYIAKKLMPYFKAKQPVILGFLGVEVLTPEFVEWLYDPFFSRFKAEDVIRLIDADKHCNDLDMIYLFKQGQLASYNKNTGSNRTRIHKRLKGKPDGAKKTKRSPKVP